MQRLMMARRAQQRLTAWLASVAMLAAALAAGQAAAAQVAAVPKGALVIAGGALRADNAEVWQRIVQLAGGPGARIAVLPTAAGNPERSGRNLVNYLNRYGAAAFAVPLSARLPGRDVHADAEDAALAQSIRNAGGIYFAGGDQALITQALVRPDGSRSAVLQAIWDVYQRGGVIAGSSAGAAIMSSSMYYNARSVFGTLSDGVRDGQELAAGLGFIGGAVFVDQHLLARGRFARMLPAMLYKGYKLGLGIDENSALVVTGQRQVEVLGYQGALLLDLSQATRDAGAKDFGIANARISYLDHGDRYDLVTGVYTPSVDKVEGKVDPAHPDSSEPVFTADILGHNAVLVVMNRLISNSQASAVGVAIAGPEEPRQGVGYEFKFSKDGGTVGYESASSEAYTILGMRLDIRPITLATPWYH
jgi:cyanophycinase